MGHDLRRRRQVIPAVAVVLSGALRILPGGRLSTDAAGNQVYEWAGLTWRDQNVSAGWARYNFEGREGRDA